ncbi:hypothetical protein C8J57DRAFT_74096 [Mycena rebaudengoi]|nr:hypothetical protein C8J57DRAFT_74096 [Mycena rebaudengoi]
MSAPRPPSTMVRSDGPPPFDDPGADIIVRSSEGVNFRTYKLLLALASPHFRGMFELPQATNQATDEMNGVPVIFLYDNKNQVCGKDIVHFLLASCHPERLQSKTSVPVEIAREVVDVAMRYEMLWAVKMVLGDAFLLEENPILVFALACRYGTQKDASVAAKETLRFAIKDFPSEPALELISGLQYHTLLQFHRRCGTLEREAAELGTLKEWIPDGVRSSLGEKHAPCGSGHVEIWTRILLPVKHPQTMQRPALPVRGCPRWWVRYMESVAELLETRPHCSTIKEKGLFDNALAQSCEICKQMVHPFMTIFIPVFVKKLDDIIREVSELPEYKFV